MTMTMGYGYGLWLMNMSVVSGHDYVFGNGVRRADGSPFCSASS